MLGGENGSVAFHGDHRPAKVATHRRSRNLLNITESFPHTGVGVTWEKNGQRITASGTSTGYPWKKIGTVNLVAGEQYNSTYTQGGDIVGCRLVYVPNAEQYYTLSTSGKNFTVKETGEYRVDVYTAPSFSGEGYVENIMLNEGTEALPFEPYGTIEQVIYEPAESNQEGTMLTFDRTYNHVAEVSVFGESVQDGTPTPDSPVPIESIKAVELVSRNADGSKSATRTIDLQGHELRSLPDGTRDELVVHRDGTVELVQRCDASMFDPSYPVSNEWKLAAPQTIQLPSIDPLPTYHPYTFVDGNGADISARVRVIP